MITYCIRNVQGGRLYRSQPELMFFSCRPLYMDAVLCTRQMGKAHLWRQQAEFIHNYRNASVRNVRQGETQHTKYKTLGRVNLAAARPNDRASDWTAGLASGYSMMCCTSPGLTESLCVLYSVYINWDLYKYVAYLLGIERCKLKRANMWQDDEDWQFSLL
jgi:hypothetical protein